MYPPLNVICNQQSRTSNNIVILIIGYTFVSFDSFLDPTISMTHLIKNFNQHLREGKGVTFNNALGVTVLGIVLIMHLPYNYRPLYILRCILIDTTSFRSNVLIRDLRPMNYCVFAHQYSVGTSGGNLFILNWKMSWEGKDEFILNWAREMIWGGGRPTFLRFILDHVRTNYIAKRKKTLIFERMNIQQYYHQFQ